VAEGCLGERVVTSFGRSMVPLIRYRTADLVVRVPATRCGCGRTFDLYEGGVLGRADDMKVVRGTNVYPRAVESIVRGCPEVDEFQLAIVTEGIRDEIYLRCELHDQAGRVGEWPAICERLAAALAGAHEGLRFRVELAEAGSLPRFELKARRLVDRRPSRLGAVPAGAEGREVYRALVDLAGREDLAPCVTANVRHALAFMAVAVADLGLEFEHLVDRGV
jgi:phenylacetate-CoA ligase